MSQERATLLAWVSSVPDRADIVLGAQGRTRVIWCDSASAIARGLRGPGVTGVIVELSPDASTDLESVVAAIEQRTVAIPLLLRADVRPRVAAQVLTAWDRLVDLRSSLRGADEITDGVRTLERRAPRQEARFRIAARVCARVPLELWDVVMGAAALAAEHVTVEDLARLLEQSVRTVEKRLEAARVLTPKHLLSWMTTLYAVFRVETLQMTARRAAEVGGSPSADGLSKHVLRTTGARLATLSVESSFEAVLARLDAVLLREN